MSKREPDWQCANCLATVEAIRDLCPVCNLARDSSGDPIVRFDEPARDLIRAFGGIYGGVLPIDTTEDVVVWCETGVFRYGPAGTSWSESTGVASDVILTESTVLIHEGGVQPTRLNLSTGESS